MTSPVQLFGWFVIGVLYGNKNRRSDLRHGMTTTLQRLAALTERPDTRDADRKGTPTPRTSVPPPP